MRLAVYHDGRVSLTVPRYASDSMYEKYILSKVSWIFEKIEYFKNNKREIVPKHTQEEIVLHKERARVLVHARLLHWNTFYNFSYKKVTIKNTKSRWGSCSKMGNLNFSYKLALLPPHLTDYIVVHELCHLKEMNHGKNFWKLVAQTIPNYRDLRRQLKGIV